MKLMTCRRLQIRPSPFRSTLRVTAFASPRMRGIAIPMLMGAFLSGVSAPAGARPFNADVRGAACATSVPRPSPRTANTAQSTLPDARMLKGIETRAQRALADFKKRKPATEKRARAEALKRGWTPTEFGFSEIKGSVSRAGKVRQAAAQSYQAFTGAGEFSAWSWDDGDPNTWEGVIYLESYDSGEQIEIIAQLWVGDENADVWDAEAIYYYGGWRYPWSHQARLEASGGVEPVRVAFGAAAQAGGGPNRSRCVMNCIRQQLRGAVQNTSLACVGTAFACTSAGPWYFACVGASCSAFALIYLWGVFYTESECLDQCSA